MTREEVRAWIAETRARQGLDPHVTDPGVLAEFAVAVTAVLVEPEVAPNAAA